MLVLLTTIQQGYCSDYNFTASEEPTDEYSSLATLTEECEPSKVACLNDTDCYHRLFYVQSTCVLGGACKPECKTAILRLYDNKFGRNLLHTDLSCVVDSVKTELQDCDLSPEGETVHCTLARQMCHATDECHTNLELYEIQCESQLTNTGKCPKPCAEYLLSVFRTAEGKKLSACQCWANEDALCQHRKSQVFDPCAEAALASPTTLANANQNGDEMQRAEWITLDYSASTAILTEINKVSRDQRVVQASNGCGCSYFNCSGFSTGWLLLSFCIFLLLS